MDDRVVVGRIAKAHGIQGEVVVDVETDHPERFAVGSSMTVSSSDREGRTLTIAASRPHQGRLLVRFAEIPDRTGAEAFRGAFLTIGLDEIAPLEDGRFYPHDLEGCEVFDASGAMLGTFARVQPSPAHDLWVVRTARGEVLVPAVREFVREVDLDARRVVLDPPEGLF